MALPAANLPRWQHLEAGGLIDISTGGAKHKSVAALHGQSGSGRHRGATMSQQSSSFSFTTVKHGYDSRVQLDAFPYSLACH